MYAHTWKKYLPVIRLLLKKSAAGEQVVTLNRIDFENQGRSRKPSCSFNVEFENGRLRSIKTAVNPRDLLDVLLLDDAAKSLLRAHHYAVSLNSDFQLKIRNLDPAEKEEKKDEAVSNG
jgi:hypothetical protein